MSDRPGTGDTDELMREAPLAAERQRLLDEDPEPIHGWFALSYANYLVLPRSILQSAPPDLQHRLVRCLRELDELFDMPAPTYWVRAQNDRGQFVHDPLADYQRGRRRIERKA